MNYQKIYDSIILRSFSRKLTEYFEKHHIVPRCRGGNNSKNNIAILTPREHLICHLLLAKIYGGNLWAAVNRMTNFGKSNSKKYEIFRKSYVKSISSSGNPRFGAKVKQTTRDAIGRANKGRKVELITRMLLSKNGKGRIISREERIKKSKAKGGKPFNVYKLEMSFYKKRKINTNNKTFIGFFESQRECSLFLNIPHQGIGLALKGKRSHVNGYIFEVVDGHI